jgi:hypothetical protein
MNDTGYSRRSTTLFYLRAAAVVVLLLAAYALVTGLGDPSGRWWALVVGLLLLAVGGWLGFAGVAPRPSRGRTPADQQPLASTHQGDEPTGGPYCTGCGERNGSRATTCSSCGAALA